MCAPNPEQAGMTACPYRLPTVNVLWVGGNWLTSNTLPVTLPDIQPQNPDPIQSSPPEREHGKTACQLRTSRAKLCFYDAHL